jgi:hypothetical protein
MSSAYRLCFIATAILMGNCALPHLVGQNPPADLPPHCSAYATVPLPEEAEKNPIPKTFPVCTSYRSYRGIGRPIDYSRARACAWQERQAQQANLAQNPEEPTAWIVGGSLILADIYFNGAGVTRNMPLAMRFACESEEGMAELALPDIAKLNEPPRVNTPFEFCHYAASTMTMNFCTSYASEVEDDRRGRFYASLKSSMAQPQQVAFEKLLDAKKAYINEHASEVDQGGTIRGMRTMGSQDILESLFHMELVHFERKRWPIVSENQIVAADTLLVGEFNKKLLQLRGKSKDEIEEGGVTADHLAKVEESWEKYRDAWAVFASLRYASEASAIRAQITLDRYRLVKTIN